MHFKLLRVRLKPLHHVQHHVDRSWTRVPPMRAVMACNASLTVEPTPASVRLT